MQMKKTEKVGGGLGNFIIESHGKILSWRKYLYYYYHKEDLDYFGRRACMHVSVCGKIKKRSINPHH